MLIGWITIKRSSEKCNDVTNRFLKSHLECNCKLNVVTGPSWYSESWGRRPYQDITVLVNNIPSSCSGKIKSNHIAQPWEDFSGFLGEFAKFFMSWRPVYHNLFRFLHLRNALNIWLWCIFIELPKWYIHASTALNYVFWSL